MDTAKISELIKWLEDMKEALGDVKVYVASDSECNSYGTIDVCGIFGFGETVIICPYKEGLVEEDIGVINDEMITIDEAKDKMKMVK